MWIGHNTFFWSILFAVSVLGLLESIIQDSVSNLTESPFMLLYIVCKVVMICFWSFLTLFPSQFLPWTSLFFFSIVYILFNFYFTPSNFSSMLSPILVGSLVQCQEFAGAELLQFLYIMPWVPQVSPLLEWSIPLLALIVLKLAPSAFQ